MNIKKVIFPEDLKDLENEISKMSSKMDLAAKQITDELANYGLEEMQKIYDSYGYLSFGSEPNTFYIEDDKNGGKNVVMEGPQAIYEEFGTGTEGEQNPHPIKSNFKLDDYNSHKVPIGTIRRAKKKDVDEAGKQGLDLQIGEWFWTFRNNVGDIVYTKGTPAQKEGYDSMNKTYEHSPEVIKKIMKEVVFND